MRVAIIGSRQMAVPNLDEYLPMDTTEIVSGGATGVDTSAREYAVRNQIKLTEFLPDYKRYGRGAPIVRNMEIIKHADLVLAFWNGKSRGTQHVIDECRRLGVPINVYCVLKDVSSET